MNKPSIADLDREIKRINRQITQAAKTFGKDSRLYGQYESALFPKSGNGLGGALLTRENKAGVIQISRSKSSLLQIQALTSYQKQVENLSKMQTVAETKQKMIEAYERRTGVKVKGREMKEDVVYGETLAYRNLQTLIEKHLKDMYELENKSGLEFLKHDEIRKLSKGRWTSEADLKRMNQLALEVTKAGDRTPSGNKLKGW